MKQKILPTLFVAGAQKSGTTSLHRFLETHPDIYFSPRPQEIHFFDIEENYSRGLDWYKTFFEGWTGEAYIAQTSPLYLYEPAVPERIAAVIPEARFIFILRNPVDRAYSHYWHEVRYGWESLSFEEALAREESRLRQGFEHRRHYSYVDRGRYASQIRRFLDWFPKRNIHVEITEQFSHDLAGVGQRCAQFLGLDASGFDYEASLGRIHNKARIPRWPQLQRSARHLLDRWPRLHRVIERINLHSASYPPLDPQMRQILRDHFLPEVNALRDLCGVDVSCWKDFF